MEDVQNRTLEHVFEAAGRLLYHVDELTTPLGAEDRASAFFLMANSMYSLAMRYCETDEDRARLREYTLTDQKWKLEDEEVGSEFALSKRGERS